MLSVRPLLPSDSEAIAFIAESVRKPNNLRSGISSKGFLVYPRTAEEYQTRVALPGPSMLATWRQEPVGFLLAAEIAALQEAALHDSAVEVALNEGHPSPVLVDQIAVLPTHRESGVGSALYRAMIEAARGCTLYADIMHAPVRNARSLNFFHERRGWTLQAEVMEGPYAWGVYRHCVPAEPERPTTSFG
jgi:ribosomal protein S18 acetylase RimI-like enzyme